MSLHTVGSMPLVRLLLPRGTSESAVLLAILFSASMHFWSSSEAHVPSSEML